MFDMGQNMVGRVRLVVRGERGASVTLSHAEMLDENGELYKRNLRSAVQEDTYVLKGGDEEVYEPLFTFHGFRYVEVAGYPGDPGPDALTGVVLHTDAPFAGRIETSHPLLNRLIRNILWGQRGNFLSIPTDCPQRDERLGWTGDAQLFCRTACYNMDSAKFYTKYVIDLADAQRESGAFPDVAPDGGYWQRRLNKRGPDWVPPYYAGWSDAGVIIPWTLYLVYADTDVLERHYGPMKKYIDYLVGKSRNFLITDGHHYGDWLAVGEETPKELLSTAFFAYSTELAARIAEALGRREDAETFRELSENVKRAFTDAFVGPDGRIRGGTQTAYAVALYMRLLPDPLARAAADHLVRNIREQGNRLTTGFVGTAYLLPALSEYGYSDVAYDLLLREEFPSWFYQIKYGDATTMWERWDGWTRDRGLHPHKMNSFNHYAFGAVGEWLYRYMAGIDVDPDGPGFRRIRIRPHPGGGLSWVRAAYDSLYGTIRSEWRVEDGVFRLLAEIPVNTTAVVELPSAAGDHQNVELDPELVREGWVRPVGAAGGRPVFEVGSGRYEFAVRIGESNQLREG